MQRPFWLDAALRPSPPRGPPPTSTLQGAEVGEKEEGSDIYSDASPATPFVSPPRSYFKVEEVDDVEEKESTPPPPPPVASRPANQPTVVDRAMEFAVNKLAGVIRARGSQPVLEDAIDTRQLLRDISSQVSRLLEKERDHDGVVAKELETEDDVVDDWDYDGSKSGHHSTSESERPSPYEVWTRRTEINKSVITPQRKPPVKLTEDQWDSVVQRLYASLRRHDIQVAATQQAIINRELADVTFTPRINARSRALAGSEKKLSDRTVQIELQRKRKLELERQRLAEKELAQTTFRPKINEHSRAMAPASSSRLFESPLGKRDMLAKKAQEEREAAEKTLYTFSPVINPKSRGMVSKGKALELAFSPAKSKASPEKNSEESFKPKINPTSRRMASSQNPNRRSVHERLYEEGLEVARKARQRDSGLEVAEKPRRAPLAVVRFRPGMEFILETLGKDFH